MDISELVTGVSKYWLHGLLLLLFLLTLLARLFRKTLVSSEGRFKHAMGMATTNWIPAVLGFECILICVVLPYLLNFENVPDWVYLFGFLSFLLLVSYLSRMFIGVFKFENRYTKDAYNHGALTAQLACIGIFIVYIIICFDIKEQTFLPFGVFAAVMGWIFQDAIKGIVAYYHLRSNGLLHIGDWIEVPTHHIDGIIIDISLVTVTVRNWDNTVSNVAISTLQTGAFKNNQEMLDRKTSGRRMYRSFLIDARSIRSMSRKDTENLKSKLEALGEDTIIFDHIDSEVSGKMLNIYLFRMYIRHWLMNHKEVTRYPRLVVRLLEQTSEGLPLQLYTYLLPTSVAPYELVQSRIMEHVILSMEWFGLTLYQRPSGEDVCRIMTTNAPSKTSDYAN